MLTGYFCTSLDFGGGVVSLQWFSLHAGWLPREAEFQRVRYPVSLDGRLYLGYGADLWQEKHVLERSPSESSQ